MLTTRMVNLLKPVNKDLNTDSATSLINPVIDIPHLYLFLSIWSLTLNVDHYVTSHVQNRKQME